MGEKLFDGHCFVRQEDGTYTEVDLQDTCEIGVCEEPFYEPDPGSFDCEFALGLYLNNEQKVLLRKYKKQWHGVYNRMCRKIRREKRAKEKARREKLKNEKRGSGS